MASARAASMVAVTALVIATVACNKNAPADRASETTTTTSNTTMSNAAYAAPATSVDTSAAAPGDPRYQMATARIAGVRCQRQVTCEQNGTAKRFTSEDDCARGESRRTQDELRPADCPAGIDTTKLQSCLMELSQQDCSAIVGSLQTVAACNTAALCSGR
jgi:hypothetical protein